MKHEDILYGLSAHDEQLFIDPNEAVRVYLDGAVALEPGAQLTLHQHRRVKVAGVAIRPGALLDVVLEQLDEDYGNPEDGSEATSEMEEAEARFLETVRALYVPWQCESTGVTVVIDLNAWASEHAPKLVMPRPAASEWPAGTLVELTEDDGSTTKTETRSAPWQLGDGTWVVLVRGRAGGYLLERLRAVDRKVTAP